MEVKSAITNMKDDKSSCDWKRRFLIDKERSVAIDYFHTIFTLQKGNVVVK